MMRKILEIENLKVCFYLNRKEIQAVKNSSFNIYEGECLAIVGESGSGKSVTALSIMKLINEN